MFFDIRLPRFAQATVLVCALGVVNLPHNVRAQTTQQSELRQWRNANSEVGRFTRGHIDLLKAERGRGGLGERDPNLILGAFKEDPAAPELTEQLARSATLQLHADVLTSQAISIVERSSRENELLRLQQATQKLWIEAVSAKEQLMIRQRIAEATSLSLELAKRMEKIGNWGRNRRIDVEIVYQSARSQLLLAEQTAFNARQNLFAQIGSDFWRLPNNLDKPGDALGLSELMTPLEQQLTELLARYPQYTLLVKDAEYYERIVGPVMLGQWQQEIDKMIGAGSSWTSSIPLLDRSKILWNHDLEKAIKARSEKLRLRIKIKTDLQQAREHLRATHTHASDILSKLHKLHNVAEEEALTRYNGMFISTWDLIAKAQTKMQADVAVAQAKQSFWIALVDIRGLLAGAPYPGPGKSSSSTEVNSAAGKGH